MKIRNYLLIISLVSLFAHVQAQGFRAPAEGKSVVYFVRLATGGFAIPFNFFHNDKFIGDFAGRNYLRYETDPGEHLFWATSENSEFLTSDLKAGGIYLVIVDVDLGFAVARVGFSPITMNDSRYERAKKLIEKKSPTESTEAELKRQNEAHATFIEDKLKKYNEKWKDKRTYKHISPDMAIPVTF
jgi:hypothetical protein